MENLGLEKTISLFLHLKPGESPNYPNGSKDNTHLRIEGAMEVARLVVEGIKENNLPIAQYIKE
jgi:lysophospholipase L1-like esterase